MNDSPSFAICRFVQGPLPPNCTFTTEESPDPKTVTRVPPDVRPNVGLILVVSTRETQTLFVQVLPEEQMGQQSVREQTRAPENATPVGAVQEGPEPAKKKK